jgi:hypothetical protein
MDWNMIGAIAEAIGAMGIIISLLYVASQVRQNSKLSRAATRTALADGAQRLASDVVENDDIARILHAAMQGQEVEPHERFRIQSRCYRDLRFWDNAFYQYKEGLLTAEEWNGFRENLKLVFQFPTYTEYWEALQVIFSVDFRNEVNSILREDRIVDLNQALGNRSDLNNDSRSA